MLMTSTKLKVYLTAGTGPALLPDYFFHDRHAHYAWQHCQHSLILMEDPDFDLHFDIDQFLQGPDSPGDMEETDQSESIKVCSSLIRYAHLTSEKINHKIRQSPSLLRRSF